MKSKWSDKKSVLLNLLALMLIAVMVNLIFVGVKGVLAYKNSVQSDFSLSFATVKLFTNEYLARRYQQITTSQLPDRKDILEFRIYTAKSDLDSLNANLPASGKFQSVPAQIEFSGEEILFDADMRFRGGLPLHWLYDKKSYRINLPPYSTILGARKFNLVNPSTTNSIADIVSYEIAEQEGLLTPNFQQARVYVNDEYNGFHFYLEQPDESLLRNNSRMPGSIYSGDTLFKKDSFGASETARSALVYKDRHGESLLWRDVRLWEKKASRNSESSGDKRDIEFYINTLNTKDPIEFYQRFNHFFDIDKYYSFWGIDTMVGGYHHDNFHNHKIYFDPYIGKFEPIEWDVRFWSALYLHKNLPINPLLRQIILNPVLEYERDQRTYVLMQKYSVLFMNRKIETISKLIRAELAADPFRQRPDILYGRFDINKVGPYSLQEYDISVIDLKKTFELRQKFLNLVMEDASADYSIIKINPRTYFLDVVVGGNSPLIFTPSNLFTDKSIGDFSIARMWKNQRTEINKNSDEIIYPGRKAKVGNALGQTNSWAISAFGNEMFVNSPIKYRYMINFEKNIELGDLNFRAENAITKRLVELRFKSELPESSDTESLHPWKLFASYDKTHKNKELSGKIEVKTDMVFSKNTEVLIHPGTRFILSPGKSIFFYGKVTAIGTKQQPIVFDSINSDVWGSIVVHGNRANGSAFKHIIVKGGSVARRNLVDYPGEFNIHQVEDFVMENCYFSNNMIGDDMLHIAYSKGRVSECLFEDSNADAIDIDIAIVKIEASTFNRIGNDAIDAMNSKLTVTDIKVTGAGDKCVSIGEKSNASIYRSVLSACEVGIAVKDESKLLVEELQFMNNKLKAISLYRKNPRYSRGGEIRGRSVTGITVSDIETDKYSKNMLTLK